MTVSAFKLEDSGFSREQVEALSEFMEASVATKENIVELRGDMNTGLEKLDGKINIVYWMLTLIIAVQVAPYLKMILGS